MPNRDDFVDRFVKDASDFTTEQKQKYDNLRGRRGKEVEMWHAWKQDPGDHTLNPLLQSYEPTINTQARRQATGLGGSTPTSAIKAELQRSTKRQIETWDPNGKSSLNSWINQGFRRTSDFIAGNRNAKYVPPGDAKKWQQFRNAHDEFKDEHGRDPTTKEMLDRLGWAPKQEKRVKTLQKGIGRELYTDMGDGLSVNDDHARPEHRQNYVLVRGRFTAEERSVGEMWFPPAGQPRAKVKDIAKKHGISEPKAYRIIANIEKQVGVEQRKA